MYHSVHIKVKDNLSLSLVSQPASRFSCVHFLVGTLELHPTLLCSPLHLYMGCGDSDSDPHTFKASALAA